MTLRSFRAKHENLHSDAYGKVAQRPTAKSFSTNKGILMGAASLFYCHVWDSHSPHTQALLLSLRPLI